MTDPEWWDALPPGVEWLRPSPGGGKVRCRANVPEEDDGPAPGPGYGFVETWACGGEWVPLAEIRTWERYQP